MTNREHQRVKRSLQRPIAQDWRDFKIASEKDEEMNVSVRRINAKRFLELPDSHDYLEVVFQ